MRGSGGGGEQQARLLADAVSEGVMEIDATGRIRAANTAACLLFGSPHPPPPGKIIGQTLLEATHLRSLSQLCSLAQKTGMTQEEELRLVGRNERSVQARAVPFSVSSGQSGVFLLLLDKTELLHLQTVRTEFVANVSHELRTPLASIRATAETLLDGAMEDPEYGRHFLKTIIREADRLVRLSQDLLELSRAESTARQYDRFDLRGLLADVGARLLTQAERRSITLSLPLLIAAPVWIEADHNEIDQVFFNLLDNAIKYTPAHGSVTVMVAADESAQTVEVVVADTGIGILSKDLPRIFERFWRADRARTFQNAEGSTNGEKTGGTGLGLSIVKHIVDAHGGVVRAESELGRGSRFIVTLPLSAAPVTTQEIS